VSAPFKGDVSDGFVWLGCGTRRTTKQGEIIRNLTDACQTKDNRTGWAIFHHLSQRLPLIEQTTNYDLVYKWFNHLKTKLI
jgi:hypothetical protein